MKHKIDIEKYFATMKTIGKKLPALAARVFALKGTGYMGSGVHYGMVKRLGWLLMTCNNFDIEHSDIHLTSEMNLEVSYKMLIEDVEAAEASLVKETEKDNSNV